MSNLETPWDFGNPRCGDNQLLFTNVREFAMGSPLAGNGIIIINGKRYSVNHSCGGPAVWSTSGEFVALPIWTKSFFKGMHQLLGIIDTKSVQMIIFAKPFRVLQLQSFSNNIICGIDSPAYKPKDISFDISKEKIKTSYFL